MKYNVVKVFLLNEAGQKIYRTFAVNQRISAEEFAIAVLSSFNVAFEHMFLFHSTNHKKSLVHRIWINEDFNQLPYDLFTLTGLINELGSKFLIEYDTGDGYEFEVRVMKRTKDDDLEEERKIILEDGAGYGIFEDAHYALEEFLLGKNFQDVMNKIVFGDDEPEYNIGVPFMCELDISATLDDYFAPLDIESLNNKMEADLAYMINYLDGCIED